MEYEDIDEDFEFAGYCVICDEMLDMSEAGFCRTCGCAFCWGMHGDWHNGEHTCEKCKSEE